MTDRNLRVWFADGCSGQSSKMFTNPYGFVDVESKTVRDILMWVIPYEYYKMWLDDPFVLGVVGYGPLPDHDITVSQIIDKVGYTWHIVSQIIDKVGYTWHMQW